MEPLRQIKSVAAPLLRDNIDTDLIIRIDTLLRTPREELGRYCFEAIRYNSDGSPNTAFALNRPEFANAQILLTGANFGCGSSREHAVWALRGMGFRCVIAPSFGEIFFSNCFQNGFLPIVLDQAAITDLAHQVEENPQQRPITIDLDACKVFAPSGDAIAFDIAARRRQGLIEGLDEIGLTLRDEAFISAFQARDRELRPWIYLQAE